MSSRMFSVIANMITLLTVLFSGRIITMAKRGAAFKDPKRYEGILLAYGIKYQSIKHQEVT